MKLKSAFCAKSFPTIRWPPFRPKVSISQAEWVRLAREVIVNTLFEKSGLQLKLTLSKQGDKVSKRGAKDRARPCNKKYLCLCLCLCLTPAPALSIYLSPSLSSLSPAPLTTSEGRQFQHPKTRTKKTSSLVADGY